MEQCELSVRVDYAFTNQFRPVKRTFQRFCRGSIYKQQTYPEIDGDMRVAVQCGHVGSQGRDVASVLRDGRIDVVLPQGGSVGAAEGFDPGSLRAAKRD